MRGDAAPVAPGPLSPVEAVRRTARRRPDQVVMTFMDYGRDRAGSAHDLSYGELDARARSVAAALRGAVGPGGRAAVLCPHTADYVAAFLGCLYAGVIAVPLFAPSSVRPDERLLLAMDDCKPEAVLTTATLRGQVAGLLGGADGLTGAEVLAVDALDPAPSGFQPSAVAPDATAYLQYTSGSTRRPAGVQVTHHNLAVGAAQLGEAFGLDGESRMVGWLPFFHDMGLLFTVVVPLVLGTRTTSLEPFAFVQRPSRWLTLLSERRATHTVSPNFGLELSVERVPPALRAGLDLSALRVLANGSEPIRPRTLERFTTAFAGCGFTAAAHRPGYGLAEATLVVTASTAALEPRTLTVDRTALLAHRVRTLPDGDRDGQRLVSCGRPVAQRVRVVDPVTREPSPPDRAGEVWVRGANVCAGYWERPEQSAEVFEGRLAGEGATARRWLRTGDLGFTHQGELYLAGRLKDLIIIDGQNHHPVDIELTVEEASRLVRPGRVAAFSAHPLAEREERLVIVAEVGPVTPSTDLAAERETIRRAVGQRHALAVHDLVLVRRGALPRTTSGKLQRAACRTRYLRRELPLAVLSDEATAPRAAGAAESGADRTGADRTGADAEASHD